MKNNKKELLKALKILKEAIVDKPCYLLVSKLSPEEKQEAIAKQDDIRGRKTKYHPADDIDGSYITAKPKRTTNGRVLNKQEKIYESKKIHKAFKILQEALGGDDINKLKERAFFGDESAKRKLRELESKPSSPAPQTKQERKQIGVTADDAPIYEPKFKVGDKVIVTNDSQRIVYQIMKKRASSQTGVWMYTIADNPQKYYDIENGKYSLIKGVEVKPETVLRSVSN